VLDDRGHRPEIARLAGDCVADLRVLNLHRDVLAVSGAREERRVFTQKTSDVLSNTLGLGEPVYFAGSKIAGVVPWVPAAGTIGMGIDRMSYNGAVTVGLQVDAGLIPDPDTIIADYEREVETLRQLALQHRNQPAARR
jgi:hypothetical protein